MSQSDPAALKALEVAKKISKTIVGGGSAPNDNSMQIPSDKVGIVIGRGGATIKEIENTTGVKLQLETTGEPLRTVYISGSDENVAKAKDMIKTLIEERTKGRGSVFNPRKTIQIPCDQVGLVIGRGGAHIRKICQDTSCRLKIESEEQAVKNGHDLPMPGYQNLHIMGSPAAADNAERTVMELLHNDTVQKLQPEALMGYGAYQPHAYQLRAHPYGTQMLGYAQGYPYAMPGQIMTPAYSTQALGYPISNGYPQQNVYPPQSFAVDQANVDSLGYPLPQPLVSRGQPTQPSNQASHFNMQTVDQSNHHQNPAGATDKNGIQLLEGRTIPNKIQENGSATPSTGRNLQTTR